MPKKKLPTLGTHELAVYLAAFWKQSRIDLIAIDFGLHQSLGRAFNDALLRLKREFFVSVRIYPHALHGDSETVHDMIHSIVCCGLGRYGESSKTLELALEEDEAKRLVESLSPSATEILGEIARKTISEYKYEPPLRIEASQTA
jgi:hypothetical protein